jgi:hypothetical protein
MTTDPPEPHTAYLVGYRLSPASDGVDLYGAILINAKDAPIVHDGRIVFFRSPDQFERALELAQESVRPFVIERSEETVVFDCVSAFDTISEKDEKTSANLLDCLNHMMDLLYGLGVELPKEHKSVLWPLANYLTFDYEFADFLAEKRISRVSVLDAIYWSIGVIVSHARILEFEQE